MKKLLLITAVFTLACAQAQAQSSSSSEAGSASNAQLLLQSDTDAVTYSDNRTINYGDAGDGKPDGTIRSRIESTGNAIAPDFGSGHPCALGASAAIGIVGGALSGGASAVDEACMMVRSSDPRVQAAGWALYAARDKQACIALRNAGVIDASSTCGAADRKAGTTFSTDSGSSGAKVALNVTCDRSGGKITPRVSRAVADAYSTAEIKAACK